MKTSQRDVALILERYPSHECVRKVKMRRAKTVEEAGTGQQEAGDYIKS